MPDDSSTVLRRARSASAEELKALIHEGNEEILLALIENANVDETHLTLLLDRLDISANVLSAVAAGGKWTSSEGIRVRIVRHPQAPRRIALSLLRQLYLFDLVRVSLMPSTPADIRRAAEEILVARVPHLPVGQKLTLARRGPSRVAGALLAEGHPQAVKLALANAFLAESQVLKVLAKAGVPARVVAAVAQHPKWSSQYNVRAALVRNGHTPVPVVLAFLPDLTLSDLREIAILEGLSPHLRKYIQQELARRAGAKSEDVN
jgi:hypothetical protein